MRIYLVVFSQAGPVRLDVADIDPRVADIAMPRAAGDWRHELWRSRDGATQLLAWSNEPVDGRLLPPLLTSGEAAIGCPGYLGEPGDLERLLRADDPGATADECSGVFGLFRAGQRGFQAVTTAVRLHPVYHASVRDEGAGLPGDVHLAGNRALLVHAAAQAIRGRRGAIDHAGIALQSLVRSGYFLGDDTPFDGVSALPAHATLEVGSRGSRVTRRELPGGAGIPRGRARRELQRQFDDSLLATVRPLRLFDEPISLSLTGGRDSRIVAAALHAGGVPFRTVTSGFDDHPDVVLARRIADLLGVEHSHIPPARDAGGDALVVPHPLRRACEVIRISEGMISAHNNLAKPSSFKILPKLSGAGGEQLRGGFLANQTGAEPEAIQRRIRGMFLASETVFTDAAGERARAELGVWQQQAAADPMGALDRIYLYDRTGRWSAAGRAAATFGSPAFNLLFDNLLNRRALAMSPAWRWSEWPVHRAIARLAPPLANLPLIRQRWRYDLRPPPWPLRRRWHARRPLQVSAGPAGFDWRNQPDAALLEVFREQILGGPAELFDIVQRPVIESLLAKRPVSKSTAVLLWNTYTTSVLLSGAWLDPLPELPPLRIEIPARVDRALSR